MSRRVRAIGSLALAVALAGCFDAPTSSPTTGPTFSAEPTPVRTSADIGLTVVYEGLLIHVDRVTSELDARGGPVDVELRVENPGTELSELDGTLTLVLGDLRVSPTRESKVPSVDGGTTVEARITFELQDVASIDDAVLEIGAAPEHVGRVPLGASGGAPALLTPIDRDIAGIAEAGTLRLRVRHLELRWDLPDWSQELTADLAALTVKYDITYTGTFAGGFAFTGENVALRLPNGKQVQARRDGHSQAVELIGAGKTKTFRLSRFEIPNGMTGRFALIVKAGGVERAIEFTIGG